METGTGTDGGHLDSLALDALRAGEGSPGEAAHAATCPRCRAAAARLGAVQEALKAAQERIPPVPRDLELRILRGYRESLRRPSAPAIPALLRRWALPAAGAAAAAALLLTINPIRLGDPGGVVHSPVPVVSAPEELAAPEPGRSVDIVDAFRLARALRDGRDPESGWDADGNGLVDDADVLRLARRSVAL
jgi:hypothetical protein